MYSAAEEEEDVIPWSPAPPHLSENNLGGSVDLLAFWVVTGPSLAAPTNEPMDRLLKVADARWRR